ncbi:hypothetical protein DXT94_28345 [Rhizobium sp. ICMP 5592]|nr:hypothetical protein [Rhizobium sp. ICMP 5592]
MHGSTPLVATACRVGVLPVFSKKKSGATRTACNTLLKPREDLFQDRIMAEIENGRCIAPISFGRAFLEQFLVDRPIIDWAEPDVRRKN